MTWGSLEKPSRTARKIEQRRTKLDRKAHEASEMRAARHRDKACRFPFCGCKHLSLQTEVAHLRHRGSGGNPSGDRTLRHILILLCNHRHRFGKVSLDKGTLRCEPLNAEKGTDGPVRWLITADAWLGKVERFSDGFEGIEFARERAPGILVQPSDSESDLMESLRTMDV